MTGRPVKIAILADSKEFEGAMDRATSSAKKFEDKAEDVARASERIDGAVEGTGDRFGDLATNAGALGGGMADLGEKIGGTAGGFLTAGGAALEYGSAIGDIGEGLAGFIRQSKLAVIAEKAMTAAKAVGTVAQRAMNAAMRANPIGIIITLIALLVAGLVWFFTKTTVGQAIVKAAWAGIQKAIAAVVTWWNTTLLPAVRNIWTTVQSFFGKVWDFMKKVFQWTPLGVIITNWDRILGFFRGLPGKVRSAAGNLFGSILVRAVQLRDSVTGRVQGMVDWLKGLPRRISSAVGNLGSLLYGKGQSLIQGLIDGIQAMVAGVARAAGNVAATIKSFLPGSPVKMGPLRSWNNGGAGKRLMDMLADGIEGSSRTVQGAMEAATQFDVNANLAVARGVPSQAPRVSITFEKTGDPLIDALLAMLKKYVRVNGGNVQNALGA